MTATNHALTGALIAAAIKVPELAIPLAFIAHFAMDAIPHFGLSFSNPFKRNQDKRFRRVLTLDIILALICLIFVPIALHQRLPLWLTFFSMVACMSPDLVWGWHFYHELRYKSQRPQRWFSKMHKAIQWSETPSGIVLELVWLVACGGTIIALAK